ncbi:RluA family pseudouridine synthase [Paracoccaceae bacterium GXU_MW_L88]
MSGVQHITIGHEDAEQRLDRWLRNRFPQLTQGRIEKLCRKGDLRVDKGRVKPATRLEEGQVVRVPPLPDEDAPKPKPETPKISDADARLMRDAVIFRDKDVIILNKPAGLAVQGGSKTTRHVDALAAALVKEGEEVPKLVHRLDKDTSGVLVLARNRRAAAALAKSFHSRKTRKVYWAALAGVPHPLTGTVRFGLVKGGGSAEKMLALHPDDVEEKDGAKHATTDYHVMEKLGTRASWAALVPVTGRTHQLRAHMAELGTPIVGDGKYGGNSQTNEGDGWGAQLGGEISRKLHLHARAISIPHPTMGGWINVSAPLPEHMKRTWEFLGWSEREHPDDPFEEME